MQAKILLYIGIANLIIGLLYFIILMIKKEKTKAFLMFIFILLCPVIALLFLFFSWCQRKLFFQKDIDIDDLSFHTEHLEMITKPDFEKEINVVSIEEALIISDNQDRRRVILDVLKEDYDRSISIINNALENEDSETSHYVASIITDVKSHFKLTVQQMKEKIAKDPDILETIPLLLDYIHKFLSKKVLTEIEEITYVEQYEQLMQDLYEKKKDAVTSEMYKDVIGHLLKIRSRDKAILWGERAMENRPTELDTYKGVLKLYFEIGEQHKFMEALMQLKNSSIEYDRECIDLFHFYGIG